MRKRRLGGAASVFCYLLVSFGDRWTLRTGASRHEVEIEDRFLDFLVDELKLEGKNRLFFELDFAGALVAEFGSEDARSLVDLKRAIGEFDLDLICDVAVRRPSRPLSRRDAPPLRP